MSGVVVSIDQVQRLYDRHRYLDAFALTADCWHPSFDIQAASIDQLLLAGRLAARLGGYRLARWLLRAALTREPDNPRVRYYTHDIARRRLLEALRDFEREPDLGGDDPGVRAWWLANHAMTWAALRDFRSAAEWLARAHAVKPDDGWVLSCESTVYGLCDRWNDALTSAERACDADDGAPFALHAVGMSLLNLGRVQEAAARLHQAAERGQSFEATLEACWFQCALADTFADDARGPVLENASWLAARLPELAPLADRDSRATFAKAHLDIAALAGDHVAMETWAPGARSPFHRQLLTNLRTNPEGSRIRLPFRRTIQRFAECLPASLSTVMSACGLAMSAEEMASEITFGGTPTWAGADWLRVRGFHVRFFTVMPDVAARLIHHQIAFVINWEADETGHAVAAVGIDERAGTVLVHDPAMFRTAEYLIAILDSQAGPLGITGMAVVAQDRAALLDGLLPPESAIVEAAQDYDKAVRNHGPSAGRAIVARIGDQIPSHPGTRFLAAVHLLDEGRVGEALKELQQLLQEFPESPVIRVRVLAACHALGNTALMRQVLANVVERGLLPGLQSEQKWLRPPARYVFEYAALLRLSAATREYGERLLHSLLRRQPVSAGAWHNLADLLWQKDDREGAVLCYRLASCLDASSEHYARSYADALAVLQRPEEGFRWLESRVRTVGTAANAVGTWLSWIGALEEHGCPDRAIAACDDALQQHPGSAALLAFAVPFFARMGLWEVAEQHRSKLKEAGNPSAFHEASTLFCQMRGDFPAALEHAEAWIRESPLSMNGRRTMLDLVVARDGPAAAVEIAEQWTQASRDHDELEVIYCEQLDRTRSRRWKKFSLLRRRVKRNPEDSWAWRELTLECLRQHELADDRRRARLAPRIERFLAECDRTSAESAATVAVHAVWDQRRQLWADAVAKFMQSAAGAGSAFSYDRAWQCSTRLSEIERRRVWAEMRSLLLNSPGRLTIARQLMGLLVTRFGLSEAEKEIDDWRVHRPDDPDLLEAAVDLLIEHGRGRSDAGRALTLLQPAIAGYPFHRGLRLSLAHAFRRAGDLGAAEKVLKESLRRHPNDSSTGLQLAQIRLQNGDVNNARQIFDAALDRDPHNPDVLSAKVEMLLGAGNVRGARDLIEDALQRMPWNIAWRAKAIRLLVRCREHDRAMAVARQGVVLYPRGAMLWFLLGRTLCEMRRYARGNEAETSLRRSLSLNRSFYDAADLLSWVLADQERYEEASEVMRNIAASMTDQSPASVRLAWIKRRQGHSADALREMIAALSAAPWNTSGWHILMGWLEEDQAWDESRHLLRDIPPQMLTNISFRVRRLELLRKAGDERAQLEVERKELARDFPGAITPAAEITPTAKSAGQATRRVPRALDLLRISPWMWIAIVMAIQLLLRNC